MDEYAQQDHDAERAMMSQQDHINYIEYQAELILEHIFDKRLTTEQLMDKIESCVNQITESVEAVR